MKKMVCLLLAVMTLACTLGSASAAVFVEPTERTYDEVLKYAEELFGFEDTRYYPYLPTFLDPVNYCGYLSMHGGVKDDLYYVVYNGWTEENVALYRGYLEYWGYEGREVPCDLPNVKQWHMTGAESKREGRPLLQTVDVYHVADEELLVVAYSYLDAWIMDEWLIHPDWQSYDHFDGGTLPCILPLNDEVTVTVEEMFLTNFLLVSSPEELSLYPYDAELLKERDMTTSDIELADASERLNVLRTEYDDVNPRNFLCVRISCSYGTKNQVLRSLRAALAEADAELPQYADCTDVPMLMLTQSETDPLLFSVAREDEMSDIWLVFPPSVHRQGEVLRLYCCLQDEQAPWIGDLRDWRYMNFWISPADFK